jgi:hypothetical protein
MIFESERSGKPSKTVRKPLKNRGTRIFSYAIADLPEGTVH